MQLVAIAAVLFAVSVAAEPATTTSSAPPHAVVSDVAPNQSPPPGCSPNYDGVFGIGYANVTNTKRDLNERDTPLGITLKGGVLTDSAGRTGYIASNQQFQFDDPPQAGAIWTAGFSICQNRTMALGNSAIWYRCLSGNFNNLYLESIGGQCVQSFIVTVGKDGGHPGSVPASLSTASFASSSSGLSSSNATISRSASVSSASISLSSSASFSNGTRSAASSSGITAHHATTRSGSQAGGPSASGTTQTTGGTSTTNGGAAATQNGAVFGLAGGLFALALL